LSTGEVMDDRQIFGDAGVSAWRARDWPDASFDCS